MSKLVDEHRHRVLQQSELLGVLEPEDIEQILKRATVRTAKKHEILVRKGETSDSLFGVLAGRAAVMGLSGEGKQIAIRLLEAGDVFGEISLLDGLPRTADVVALERTDYFALYRREFEQFVLESPKAALRLMGVLARRLRLTSEALEDVTFLPLRERLAKTLLRLASRYGQETDEGRRIELKLPLRVIAEMVGSTRETTNLIVREWEESGVLSRDERRFVVRDENALRKLATGG